MRGINRLQTAINNLKRLTRHKHIPHVFAWSDNHQPQIVRLDRWQIFKTMDTEVDLALMQSPLISVTKIPSVPI
ncbi:hypothetical protein KDW_56100 [Dictyobacter vulcani]|uniref:Uncharacterized protein n=1 Tax=Dictyobacter vulcani TaxID=2607529 RepID=A0A5J4KNY3_9CHLR|nr:hypothetical protein KDW_56100 [Dictyobacter vulcani]